MLSLPSLPIPTPTRWFGSISANIYNFGNNGQVLGEYPIPDEANELLQNFDDNSWGEVTGLIIELVKIALSELGFAMMTHPISTLVLLWASCETVLMVRRSKDWIVERRRRSRGELN